MIYQKGGKTTDLVRMIRGALPVRAVDSLLQSVSLTHTELEHPVLSGRALMSRGKAGRLTPDQSDRLVRVVHVIAEIERAFGSLDKATA